MNSRVPMRTCIGCRRRTEQGLLLRISRTEGGEIALTDSQSRTGRGAYICPDPNCVAEALKGDRLSRALRTRFQPEHKARIKEVLECKLR